MNEGLGYRRLPPTPRSGSPMLVIMQNELAGLRRNQIALFIALGTLLFSMMYVGLNVYAIEQQDPGSGHTIESFVYFLDVLRWLALAMAAVLAGPGLLEDSRQGALELYLSRPLRHSTYLVAKALPTLLIVTLTMWLPPLLYYGMSFFTFENNPAGWHATTWQSLVYAIMWAVPVTGAGFAVSCVARAGLVAALWIVGVVFMLDILVADLISVITSIAGFEALSPLALHGQQQEWLFDLAAPHDFKAWWGAIGLAAITLVGWATMAWRYPRLRGGEA